MSILAKLKACRLQCRLIEASHSLSCFAWVMLMSQITLCGWWGTSNYYTNAKMKRWYLQGTMTKTVSVNLWYYIFFYNAHPLHAHWYSYFFTPQHTWLFSLSLIMQTWLTHTQTQKYSKHRHIYRETRTHCERASLMDSEDSNFPSATKDRKPSELNYPCLTHTRQDYKHIHTSTHLDIIGCNRRHAHTHFPAQLKPLWHVENRTIQISHTVKLSRALV